MTNNRRLFNCDKSTNLRCLAQPVNNAYGIAVDYPLSCWCWNNTIAPSHHSNACLVYIPANYPIFLRRPRIRRYRCPCAYYSNTSASFHPLLIGDLVFKLNPGSKGIPVIVSTRIAEVITVKLNCHLRRGILAI